MERVAVPFSMERYALDLRSATTLRGVVRMEPEALVVEFRETTTNLSSMAEADGEVRTVRIPVDELEAVDVARRLLGGARLRIRTRTLAALRDAPGAAGNEWVLNVRRRDRMRARELSVGTALLLSGRELRRVEEGED